MKHLNESIGTSEFFIGSMENDSPPYADYYQFVASHFLLGLYLLFTISLPFDSKALQYHDIR